MARLLMHRRADDPLPSSWRIPGRSWSAPRHPHSCSRGRGCSCPEGAVSPTRGWCAGRCSFCLVAAFSRRRWLLLLGWFGRLRDDCCSWWRSDTVAERAGAPGRAAGSRWPPDCRADAALLHRARERWW